MIDQLLACLRSVDLQPTPEELAEALWLAQYLPVSLPVAEPSRPPPRSAGEESAPRQEPHSEEQEPEQTPEAPPLPGSSGKSAGAKLVHPELSRERTEAAVQGSLVRAPAAAALPHSRELGHAFRPLRRRVPSRVRVVLDEEATAHQVAETGGRLWSPVFVPAPTRWMELALVVDGSPSMAIWSQTLFELERLLEHLGVFRDVRRWTLDTVEPRGIRLYAGHAVPVTRAERPLRELIDPAGRRLVLVVSDCIAPAWHSGAVAQGLREWGRAGPVAVVQVLPQRMWVRTALRVASRAALRARSPGVPNVLLEPESRGRSRLAQQRRGLAMPVMPLERLSIAEWARMVASGGVASQGWVLPPAPWKEGAGGEPQAAATSQEEAAPDAAKVIQLFRGTASPLAQELASLLAAAPLALPVMRLVQQVMLPDARQVHLAEVLLGGLLREVRQGEQPRSAQEVRYEFLPGVRERLMDSLTRGRALEVLRRVSDFIGARFGQGRDFAAALVAPEGEILLPEGEASEPFAMVAATVLRRLGGQYARLAERLHSEALAADSVRRLLKLPEEPPARSAPTEAKAESAWAACALVHGPGIMANAYLVAPRRFVTAAHALNSATPGARVRVYSTQGWHEATVLGADSASDCAVVEIDDDLKGVVPLELMEDVPEEEEVEVRGLSQSGGQGLHPWAGKGTALRMQQLSGGRELLGLTLKSADEFLPHLMSGMPVLARGRVIGHVTHFSQVGRLLVAGLARSVRRLLSPMRRKPREQRALVAGTGDPNKLTDNITWISVALGVKLAREGYSLVGGGWPGVDEIVGRAYLATLRLMGENPQSRFLQVVPQRTRPTLTEGELLYAASENEVGEKTVDLADAVIVLGGALYTMEAFQRALQEGKPVFPLPATGGTAADAYRHLRRSWQRRHFGKLSRQDLESLGLSVGKFEDAALLADTAVELMTRALEAPAVRPARFAEAMLDLLLVNEPRLISSDIQRLLGPGWVAYCAELVGLAAEDPALQRVLQERFLNELDFRPSEQEAIREKVLGILRDMLPKAGPWLRGDFLILSQLEEGELKWRLLAQLTPLVLRDRSPGLAVIASLLQQRKPSPNSVGIEMVLEEVREHFDSFAEFQAWLAELVGVEAKDRYLSQSTSLLSRLGTAYLTSQNEKAANRALATLRETLQRMRVGGSAFSLPLLLESKYASVRLAAYVLIQLQPAAEVFSPLLRHFKAELKTRPLEPRLLEVLMTALVVVSEAAVVDAGERLKLWDAAKQALGDRQLLQDLGSRGRNLKKQWRLMQSLGGQGSRPLPKFVLIGPHLAVQGVVNHRGEQRWEVSLHERLDHDRGSVKKAVERFNALPAQERFIAFDHEAHLVKNLLVAAKPDVPRSFRLQTSSPLARINFAEVMGPSDEGASGGEPGPYLEQVLTRAFAQGRFWERLAAVASRQSASTALIREINNLLRLEITRLAALPLTADDLLWGRTALQCVEYVHNAVALSNLHDDPFDLGMVLTIRGYGTWSGAVSLSRV